MKFGVLYTVSDIQNNTVLTAGFMLKGYHTLVPDINSIFFRDSMGPFKFIFICSGFTQDKPMK